MEKISVVPAYKIHQACVAIDTAEIVVYLTDVMKKRANNNYDMRKKVQSWEAVKGIIQYLKDINAWDYDNRCPNMGWAK